MRNEDKSIGKEVGEGKEWQMKGSRKGVRGGGWRRQGEEEVGRRERGGEGVRVRGTDEIGWRVGRKEN